ncbi:MAG: transcription termination/antitermination protein NusG [Oscillospiraceae bacterium]|nr:transcription termination/antitermination protein NusG [Oscillospiraceae bacterium]
MEDNAQAKWYVAHTYSGYENKVKQNIEKVVENRRLQDMIQEVRIPLETTEEAEAPVEEEGGRKRKKEDNKLFPSYVLIKMVMTDDTWYIVRNTRGVTGFVGPGSKPVPLSDREVAALGVDFVKVSEASVGFEVGDTITVTGGPFNGWLGSVQSINIDDQTAVISVSMFGRETEATIAISQIKKLED